MAQQFDLEEAAEQAEDLPDPREIVAKDEEIPIRELFDEEFVRENTDFDNFDEMVAASPSDATSADDLELVPDGEWDEFVAEHTVFDDEEEMVFAVRDHWVAAALDLN
ncbi:hypothetical protein DVK02_12540 [Halobellus sp. Atlit-31R]|nr:hypothetical protein DVK02_12540 [Halobellus sp. Atlit-31R]